MMRVLYQSSLLVKAFFVGLLITAIILVSFNWGNVFVLPFVFGAPALIIYLVYWRGLRLGEPAQDDTFWRMFAAGCLPGALMALGIELVISLLVAAITLGPQFLSIAEDIAKRQAEDPSYQPSESDVALRKNFGYWVYIFLNAFLVAATTEECVKVALVRHTCCGCSQDRAWCIQRPDPRPKQQAYTTISLLLATSLGFSLAENILYVFAGTPFEEKGLSPDLGWKILLASVRAILAMPVHATCACFTGLRLTLRDLQRRQRDGALLAQAAASGVPQFAVLPSGVPIAVGGGPVMPGGSYPTGAAHEFPPGSTFAVMPGTGSPQFVQPPGAGGPAMGIPLVAAGPMQQIPVSGLVTSLFSPVPASGWSPAGFPMPIPGSAQDAAALPVWSWARVLWPAILIHGSYDFIAMMLAEMADTDEVAAVTLTFIFAGVIVIASAWALRSQFHAAFDHIANGHVPADMTCAPVWWPARVRTCAESVCGFSLPETGWPELGVVGTGSNGHRMPPYASNLSNDVDTSSFGSGSAHARAPVGASSFGSSAAAESLAYAPPVGGPTVRAGAFESGRGSDQYPQAGEERVPLVVPDRV